MYVSVPRHELTFSLLPLAEVQNAILPVDQTKFANSSTKAGPNPLGWTCRWTFTIGHQTMKLMVSSLLPQKKKNPLPCRFAALSVPVRRVHAAVSKWIDWHIQLHLHCICHFPLHCMNSFPTPWPGVWHWHWHATYHMSVELSVHRLGTVLYNIRGTSIPVGNVHGYTRTGQKYPTAEAEAKASQTASARLTTVAQWHTGPVHIKPFKSRQSKQTRRTPEETKKPKKKKNDLQTGARPLNSPAPYQLSRFSLALWQGRWSRTSHDANARCPIAVDELDIVWCFWPCLCFFCSDQTPAEQISVGHYCTVQDNWPFSIL